MKKIPFPLFILLLISALMLSACGAGVTPTATASPPSATPSETSAPVATSTTAVEPSETAAPTVTQALPTATAAPVDTATPAPTATGTSQPSAAADCNAAEFVSDVTIPNLAVVASDQSFIKTWAVKNIGSCTWTTEYALVFTGGFNMYGPTKVNLPQPVTPGETADISIKLVVPSNSGVYQAEYKLADAQGNLFGVGPGGSDPLVVRIQTAITPTPSLGYSVTKVSVSVDEAHVTAKCPPGHTFNFSANITVNARGTVTYHWVFSDGKATGTEPLSFNAAGSHTVTTSWTVGDTGAPSTNPYRGYAQLYVDIPNNAALGQATIELTCTP